MCNSKKRSVCPAFTMIELIMVIVVIGILAALAIPRLKRDIRQEAAINILSAIRYTQHLALNDDKTDPIDPNWQCKLWQIRFNNAADRNGIAYVVFSDQNCNSNASQAESAIDPANGKRMYNQTANTQIEANESPNIFIGKKYGINQVTLSGGCGQNNKMHIAFDHLGRPFSDVNGATNNYSGYMTSDCNITFQFEGGQQDLSIIVTKETGYAYIEGQTDK